jgi:hypothetical protein
MITANHICMLIGAQIGNISEARIPPVSCEVLKSFIEKLFHQYMDLSISDREHLYLYFEKNNETGIVFCFQGINQVSISTRRKIKEFLIVLSSLVKRYGWFINDDLNYWFAIRLFPNYTELVTNIPKLLYHATDPDNVDTIIKRGLIPKEGSQWHSYHYPPRVFFFQLRKDRSLPPFVIKSQVILQIDTTVLGRNVKFYCDTNVSWDSVWTYSHIPPEAISIWRKDN